MDVLIIATKACMHRVSLEQELDGMQIEHRVCFVEDCPDLVHRFSIRHSPNLVVDDELVFRKQPTEAELHAYFGTKMKASLLKTNSTPRKSTMTNHLEQRAIDCLEACNACATACGTCFSQMVGNDSKNACPARCIECAAVCRLCADAIARDSPYVKQICKLCADVCGWCAGQCGAHDIDHCKRCAEACRRCAVACGKMAA